MSLESVFGAGEGTDPLIYVSDPPCESCGVLVVPDPSQTPQSSSGGDVFFVVLTKLSFVKPSRAETIATPPCVTFGHSCSSPLAPQFPVRERAAIPAQAAHSQLLIPDSQKESNELLGAGEESSGLSRILSLQGL